MTSNAEDILAKTKEETTLTSVPKNHTLRSSFAGGFSIEMTKKGGALNRTVRETNTLS